MLDSDALILGEDFISEHYFTTEAKSQSYQARVLERRKSWDAARDEGARTSRSDYLSRRGALTKTFIGLAENADVDTLADLYETLRHTLGFSNEVRWETRRYGPMLSVRTRGLSGPAPLVIVEAQGTLDDLLAKDEKTLLSVYAAEDDTEIVSVARLLSHLFVADDGPRFALVMAGPWLLISERERWPEGRYLAVNLQLIAERADDKRGGETDRALACIDADSLAPDAEGDVWWTSVIDESVKHTVGVSQDLREGVRLSIEIIANEVVARRAAKGLDPLAPEQAQPLAQQSLRFLYRILFLLYAEASPELGVLPVGEQAYERGYSIDRLRELTLTELASARSYSATHLYESLAVLFRLVNRGHDPGGEEPALAEGLMFRDLRADLFKPEAIALINEVKLGDGALQEVFRHLLLSKQVAGRDRGFISYAQLGINQLGAVYEGLMSYTGSFAAEDLYEVAKNGDSTKGSWVVSAAQIEGISSNDFVRVIDQDTRESRPVVHRRGTFVYRLAGRERQQSASYYSPEVLTRFVVEQALNELIDQHGDRTSARDILDLTVCEPALGSGAFAIEAVQQLAEQYLSRRQDEVGERIDPERYASELQRVKAYIALHQVYGVDLNSTAVEFAEISLWLSTMGEGLAAPWFGLHLKRGNSLVGARRAVLSPAAITQKGWLKAGPEDRPLSALGESLDGAVHHFLVPNDGWGSPADAKEAKDLAPVAFERIKDWRTALRPKLKRTQIGQLSGLARRVETLWQLALRRLQIAEQQIRRTVDVWGAVDIPAGGVITREKIEESLAEERGAYRRIRRVMDAWCALWYWPLTDEIATVEGVLVSPPTIDQWIDALEQLLGSEPKLQRQDQQQYSISDIDSWDDLGAAEVNDLIFAQAKDPSAVLATHRWLVVCERIAAEQNFFHWELEFAPVFVRGGFDLQVGNPPWVRPDWDEASVLAEYDVHWALYGRPPAEVARTRRDVVLADSSARRYYLESLASQVALRQIVSNDAFYPHLSGLRADLYRCFMEQTWRHAKGVDRAGRGGGVIGLVHPESHFTDEKAGALRAETYRRLRRHWQFVNELTLFEIDHHVSFGVHVYGPQRDPDFAQATSLYHPDTAIRSMSHDGSGAEPGVKTQDGVWDRQPHKSRILNVNFETLRVWHSLLEDSDTPVEQTRMVYAINSASASAQRKISEAPRLAGYDLEFFLGLDETLYRRTGIIETQWGRPNSWEDVILQGPNFHIGSVFNKHPNPTMANNLDYSTVDLEALRENEIPTTSYKPGLDRSAFDRANPRLRADDSTPLRLYYRVLWRSMAASTGERTLIPCIVPPGTANLKQNSYGLASLTRGPLALVLATGILSSLLADFLIRAAPKSSIPRSLVERLPALGVSHPIAPAVALRILRLNCLTSAYSALWLDVAPMCDPDDCWTGGLNYPGRAHLAAESTTWSSATPLRRASDRRQALVELDALVAIALELSVDELTTIYRTQFGVLYGYDRNAYLYDANGRLVPGEVLRVWRTKGERISAEERTATNQADNTYIYELPFRVLDREADMRTAYAEFEKRLSGDE